MTRAAPLVIALLLVCTATSGFALLSTRQQLEESREHEDRRVKFCQYYQASVATLVRELEAKPWTDRWPRIQFDYVMLEPSMSLCVADSTELRQKLRTLGPCDILDEDYRCLATLARELAATLAE